MFLNRIMHKYQHLFEFTTVHSQLIQIFFVSNFIINPNLNNDFYIMPKSIPCSLTINYQSEQKQKRRKKDILFLIAVQKIDTSFNK